MTTTPLLLTTSRLLLRDFVESDKAAVYAFRSDTRATDSMDFAPQTRKESDDWVETVIFHNSQRPRRSFNLAITTKDDGEVIGWIGFGDSSRKPGPGNYGVGYMVHSNHWGREYTTEAVTAITEFIFGTLKGNSISAWCWMSNIGSARVLEKCGFELTRRFNSINPKTKEQVECLGFEKNHQTS